MNDLYQDIYRDMLNRFPDRTVWRGSDIAEYENIHPNVVSRKYRPGRAGLDTATYARLKAGYAMRKMPSWQKQLIRRTAP